MRYISILSILVIMSVTRSLFPFSPPSDNSRDLETRRNMSEFNPNGFNTSSNGSMDGDLIVTPSNLNAIYSIPLSNENYNGTGIDFSLVYNGGIQHNAILGIHPSNVSNSYSTYSKKIPTWMLSVNGFVVQAFVENRTVFADANLYSEDRYSAGNLIGTEGSRKYIFSNKDFNFSIPGYHYSNRIDAFTKNENYSDQNNNNDKIHILKADGSLLTLVNENDLSQSPGINRTGTYLEYGANSNGFALVEEIQEPALCTLVADYSNRKPRRVRYFPGDGLEYVFIEYITPYGIDITKGTGDYAFSSYLTGLTNSIQQAKNTILYMPTVFYLSEILNDNQRIAEFYYDRQHPYDNPICSDGSFGRARLINFNNNWIDYGKGEINIRSAGRNTKLHFHGSDIKEDIDNFTLFGGRLEHWRQPGSEINLFKPHNIHGYFGDVDFLNSISKDISLMKDVPLKFTEISQKVSEAESKSENHFYLLKYVDYLLITEGKENELNEVEVVEKRIDFEYEKIIKSLELNEGLDFNSLKHPVLPFIGIASDKLVESGEPGENYYNVLKSEVQLEGLRLKSIKEPSKIIDLNYFSTINNKDVNDMTQLDIQSNVNSMYFHNDCIEEIEYRSNDNDLYLREKYYELVFGNRTPSFQEYYSDCFQVNSTNGPAVINNTSNKKKVEYFEPGESLPFKTLTYLNKSVVLQVPAVINEAGTSFEQTVYTTVLPEYQSVEYKSNDNSFEDYKTEVLYGYRSLCNLSNQTLNLVKPYYITSFIYPELSNPNNKLRTSLTYYEYEVDNALNYKELTTTNNADAFNHLITKEIKYIYKPDINISDYNNYFNSNKNNYLVKEISEFEHYELFEGNINIDKQFYNNENAFLKKYYDNAYLNNVSGYHSEMRRLLGMLFGGLESSTNSSSINSKTQKNNETQTDIYTLSSDQFSLEYYLCYLLQDYRQLDNIYSDDYGNIDLTVKPKFGILKSKKLYKSDGLGGDILLNGIEFELEDQAFNGLNLTYAQGKVIEEKVLESELYGGDANEYITNKLIEYSVGAQGGGYPYKITYPNGAVTKNYYVYNDVLHINSDGSNPVFTVQDYWDPTLVDDDSYPCDNKNYFTPAGKTIDRNRLSYNDKLIESKDVFRRSRPVGVRNFVRKFKPDENGIIQYFDEYPDGEVARTVIGTTLPSHISGSYYTPALGNEITSLNSAFEYDDLGRLTADVDVNGYISRYSYDNFGRIKKVNLPYDFNPTVTNGTESRLAIDAVTMTKERYAEVDYEVVNDNNELILRLIDIRENTSETEKVIFDNFNSGGQGVYFEYKPNNQSEFSTSDPLFTEDRTVSSGLLTFRKPARIDQIISLDRAFISLNIKELPVVHILPTEEQNELNLENLVLYLRIPGLEDKDGNDFQRKIMISPEHNIVVAGVDQTFDYGVNQSEPRIIIELGDYLYLDDLKDLMNAEQNLGPNGKVNSSKLIVEISPLQLGDENLVNLELYQGEVKFYNNSIKGHLNPKLVLEGEISTFGKRDRNYFMKDEFTMMNNYGNFGDYVNSYRKIDNNPKDANGNLQYMNFFNSYSKLGFNYSTSKSKIQDNGLSNGFYFLKQPVGYDHSSLNVINNNLDFNGIPISTIHSIYDESNNPLTVLETKNKYHGSGEMVETELNDGTKLNIEYKYSDATILSNTYSDINFYGFAKKVKTIKHDVNNDIADLDIYDLFGNVVLSFKNITDPTSWNPAVDQYSKLVKYYYDLNKNVRKVSEYMGAPNKFRNIYYWYDVFGRVNHSYHPDFGYTHFSYDDSGNLRFKQDQKQFEEDRVSYYQYDDLNRLVVSGDAKIDPTGFPNGFIPTINDNNGLDIENATFSTMLDVVDVNGDFIINPNLLNDGGESVDGNGNRILTSNKTLFKDRLYDCYIYDGIINDTLYNVTSVPLISDKANSILGTDYDLPPSGIVRKNYVFEDVVYPNGNNNGAQPHNFEEYDTFIKRVNFFDELPPRIGRFWKYMPKTEFIDYLSFDDGIFLDAESTLYNLKGRVAVQAYRDYEKQPFNFIYYSYDARGRIESLIRFTENIGFDCIYYQYNSLDKITKMIAMGSNESIKTAYEYDGFGRLEKVYSSVDGGHGLSAGTDFLLGSPPTSSLAINFLDHTTMQPDIVYTYDSDNKIASTTYSPSLANIKISNSYTASLRMLEQIITLDGNSNVLFTEAIGYDQLQRIDNVINTHYQNGIPIKNDNMTYGYDNINQLVAWTENMNPVQQFNYDALGNRTSSTNFQDAPDILVNYTYDVNNPESSRLLQADQPNKWKHTYDYFSTGQLRERVRSKKVTEAQPGGQDAVWTHTMEKYDYNSFGLLKEYKSDYYFGSEDCEKPYYESDAVVWRYGYNPFNERESKRMVKSPDGDMGGNTYPMMYYMLDEKNRQHINYLGMQSSNPTLLSIDPNYSNPISVPNKFPNYYWPTCLWNYGPPDPPSKSEQVLIYPAQLNVFGGGMTPQISYKYDNASSSWKKHYNIYDHLGTLSQTYKEDLNGIIPTSMLTHNPYGGDRWTNSNLTETESTLLNWVGKEKDNESKLGDHGVRKYEYETGRFISIDPLWSRYFGWTPYQYSMNSPTMLVDIDGFKGKKPNYFGELVEPAKNEDFTFNNAFNGYIAGVANGYLFWGFGGDNLVPDYMLPFFQAGENTADYVSLATGPLGVVKNTTKKMVKEVGQELGEAFTKEVVSRIQATSLKEFKSLIKQLSKPGSELTTKELEQFKKLTEEFGGTLRYDLTPVKGRIKPHVQVEGLGKSVESRHIWLEG